MAHIIKFKDMMQVATKFKTQSERQLRKYTRAGKVFYKQVLTESVFLNNLKRCSLSKVAFFDSENKGNEDIS